MMDVEYYENGKVAVFGGKRYIRDDKTGYYLHHENARETGTRLHRDVWEYYNKKRIPKGYAIHHIDHDKTNNDIENLMLIKSSEHTKLHGVEMTCEQRKKRAENIIKKCVPAATIWHGSEEGRKWHSEHAKEGWKNKKQISYICDNCGKEFQSLNSYSEHQNKFCSNNCKSAFRKKSGIDDVERACKNCGKIFIVNKYAQRKYCGRKCANMAKERKLVICSGGE